MECSIEATTYIRAAVSEACDVLRHDPLRVFSAGGTAADRRNGHVRASLAVRVGSGTSVEQEVDLDVGRSQTDGEVITLPIRWRPATHRQTLPSFGGELVLRPDGAGRTRMSLRGTYQLPLGPIGRFGDSVVGRRLARRSIIEFLNRIALNLDAAVDSRPRSISCRPAPYPPDMRERLR